MKKVFVCVAALGGIMAVACGPVAAQVKVWQGTFTLPTYEEGAPDPNPPFDTYATTQFNYPYTLRTSLTGQKKDHAWRAVFLENKYLKCTILPDIGGHLYTCTDKISGKPMFYANPSIKKAQIGYRGAWAAFGIEFNFPVSHNWISMSPVDFSYATHPDGSASVSVGNIDRVYGMQWRVELVLRPDSTLLEEKVTLYNRSDLRHRYYWWNNAGIEVWDNSHIEYPMRFVASHHFTDVYHWPIAPDGKDLSIIKNETDGPVSFFVHGSREPFMGIWNPKTETGTVHYAKYSELPAKKIWSWGADAEGLGWRKALSDNDSAYVEVQAGLFRNQETYAFLNPGQVIRFNEYWMPVRGTGGISRANKAGVVFIQSHGPEATVALNVNEPVPGAHIRLSLNGQTLWEETSDLAPERTWSHSIAVKDSSAKVMFELKDRAGKMLLQQTDGKYDWDPASEIKVGPQHVYRIPDAAGRTEDDWVRLGTDQELNGKIVLALATYDEALTKYPNSFALQLSAGRLAASLQHDEEAAKLLQSVHDQDTPNAEVAYYLGIAEEGLGHTRKARFDYEIAYRQVAFRARAAARIAELLARQGDLNAARSFLSDAVKADPQDSRIEEQLEAVTRAMGDTVQADQLAHRALAEHPMSDFLKEEMGTPNLPHLAADPYRVLRIATEYMNLGLYRKALTVLDRIYPETPSDQSEPGSVLPQKNPLVLYYSAYSKSKLGTVTSQDWQAAQRLSTSLIFPSSRMDREVLEAAIAADDNDATAHYLLGTLLFSKALYGSGMKNWADAKRLNPNIPVLDADIGKAWLHIKNDPHQALAAFREGVKSDPENPDIYVGLDESMSLIGASAEERAKALALYPSIPDMPATLVYQLALTRAEAGSYDDALALFKGRFFPSAESGASADQVQFQVELMQAQAKASAGSCADAQAFLNASHPGLVLNGSIARANVQMAKIAKSCRDLPLSKRLLQKAAGSTAPGDTAWSVKAEKLLGTGSASQQQQKLKAALDAATGMTVTSAYTGWWWYNVGDLQAALHHEDQAREAFRKALLLPDSMMSHHLARTAMAATGVSQ